MTLATIVDWNSLWQASAAALVAGTGVALSFSLAIFGAARSSEERRRGNQVAAFAASALMVLGLLVSLAAIVAAVALMIAG